MNHINGWSNTTFNLDFDQENNYYKYNHLKSIFKFLKKQFDPPAVRVKN